MIRACLSAGRGAKGPAGPDLRTCPVTSAWDRLEISAHAMDCDPAEVMTIVSRWPNVPLAGPDGL
jgi:hypothetical protein